MGRPIQESSRQSPALDSETCRADETSLEHAYAAAEALDVGLVLCSASLEQVLYANPLAIDLLGGQLTGDSEARTEGTAAPLTLCGEAREAMSMFLSSRRATGHTPPAVRVEVAPGTTLLIRSIEVAEPPPRELLILREEVVRNPALFRLLEARFGLTRREFHVVCGLREGKSNGEIASDLGLSSTRVSKLVASLLRRFHEASRTGVVHRIERIASGCE